MEQELSKDSRHNVVGRILFLYALPTVVLSIYAHIWNDSWGVLSLGLMFSAMGSFACLWILREWQQGIKRPVTIVTEAPSEPDYTPFEERINTQQHALLEAEQKHVLLEHEKQSAIAAIAEIAKERDTCLLQAEALHQEFHVYKNNAHDQLEHHKTLLAEQQRTIGELRETLEKKQQYLQQLESKTRDLNFELKTLLQISEKPVEIESEMTKRVESSKHVPQEAQFQWDVIVRTPEEAHVHLKRCLDIAQRMMGASHLNSNSRFRELTMDSFALDLRRLFDRFREINASTVFVYSPKEQKVLFVNDHITHLLGITPEKFVQQFQDQLQMGMEGWKTAIDHLAFKSESKLTLSLKSKTGQELPLECLLGMVPTGIFRHYIIGLLY